MNKEQKIKVERFLFSNDEIRKFLCNDFYQELKNIIPSEILFCKENINKDERSNNLLSIFIKVTNFIKKNKEYERELCKIFRTEENHIYNYIDELVMGYVFFISLTEEKYKGRDIFEDKQSIYWSSVPLSHIL